mmetsp:Transcript_3250/g.20199  ORF Transcript_3250/g.20199 Transcript_3250/m.20199 type:complete len:273 (+) Transcript_3250:3635-4453(+)
MAIRRSSSSISLPFPPIATANVFLGCPRIRRHPMLDRCARLVGSIRRILWEARSLRVGRGSRLVRTSSHHGSSASLFLWVVAPGLRSHPFVERQRRFRIPRTHRPPRRSARPCLRSRPSRHPRLLPRSFLLPTWESPLPTSPPSRPDVVPIASTPFVSRLSPSYPRSRHHSLRAVLRDNVRCVRKPSEPPRGWTRSFHTLPPRRRPNTTGPFLAIATSLRFPGTPPRVARVARGGCRRGRREGTSEDRVRPGAGPQDDTRESEAEPPRRRRS